MKCYGRSGFNTQSVDFLDALVFVHVPHPAEESEEADSDQQFVEEQSHERDDFENSFENIAQKIPDHGSVIYGTNIGNTAVQEQSKFPYF
jgi:hypothetical protein